MFYDKNVLRCCRRAGWIEKKKTHSGSEFAGRIRMRDVFFVAFAVGN